MAWLELHDAENPDQLMALPAEYVRAVEVFVGRTVIRLPWALYAVAESPREVVDRLRELEPPAPADVFRALQGRSA